MKSSINKNQFYVYSIFTIVVILFFAVLAIFYNYMEFGIFFNISNPSPHPHIFKWMKDEEPRVEPIIDPSYRSVVDATYNINPDLVDDIYLLQTDINSQNIAKLYHMGEIEKKFGSVYPIEPFENSGSLQNLISNMDMYDKIVKPEIVNSLNNNNIFSYGSGKNLLDKINENYKK